MIFSEEPAYLTSGACRIDPSLHPVAIGIVRHFDFDDTITVSGTAAITMKPDF
jgi:hypothetical protein